MLRTGRQGASLLGTMAVAVLAVALVVAGAVTSNLWLFVVAAVALVLVFFVGDRWLRKDPE